MATISKKSETLDWSVIQKVDVASLYEGDIAEEKLETLYDSLIRAKIDPKDPQTTPENLAKLFEITQLCAELKNLYLEEAENQISELEATANNQDEQINHLQSLLDGASAAEFRKMKEQINNQQTTHSATLHQLATAEEALETEKAQTLSLTLALREEQTKSGALQDTVSRLTNDVEQYKSQVAAQKERLANVRSDEGELSRQIREKNAEIDKYLDEIRMLSTENAQLQDDVDNMTGELEATVVELDNVSKEKAEMEELLVKTDRTIEELRAERDVLKMRLEEVSKEASIDTMEKLPKSNTLELNEHLKTITHLRESDNERQTVINSLKSEIQNLRDELESANIDRMKREIREKDVLVTSLRTKLEESYQDFELLSADWDKIQSTLSSHLPVDSEVVANHVKKIEKLKLKALSYKEHSKAYASKAKEMEKQLEEKEKELVETKSRLEKFEAGAYGLKDAIEEIKDLKVQKSLRDKNIQDLTSEINDFTSQVDLLMEENEAMREMLGIHEGTQIETKSHIARRNIELQQLKSMNIALQTEIERLEDERLNLKSQLRFHAIERGERAFEMGLSVEDAIALEQYADKLKNKDTSSSVERPVLQNQSLDKFSVELESIHRKLNETNDRCGKLQQDNLSLKEMNQAMEGAIRELSVGIKGKKVGSKTFANLTKLANLLEEKNQILLVSSKNITPEFREQFMKSNKDLKEENFKLSTQLDQTMEELNKYKTLVIDLQLDKEDLRDKASSRPLKDFKLPAGLSPEFYNQCFPLVDQLIDITTNLRKRESELKATKSDLQRYHTQYGQLVAQYQTLSQQHETEVGELSTKLQLADNRVKDLEIAQESSLVKISEMEKLVQNMKLPVDELKVKLVDLSRETMVFKLNEKKLKRQNLALSECEKIHRKRAEEIAADMIEMDKVARETILRLQEYYKEAIWKADTALEDLRDSVSQHEYQKTLNELNITISKYRTLLEKQYVYIHERGELLEKLKQFDETIARNESLEVDNKALSDKVSSLENAVSQLGSAGELQRKESENLTKVASLQFQLSSTEKRMELMEKKYKLAYKAEEELRGRLREMEQSYLDSMDEKLSLQESEAKIRCTYEGGSTKDEHHRSLSLIKDLQRQVESSKMDVERYKNMVDHAMQQVMDYKHKINTNDSEKELLRAAIQELQMEGDEKLIIGKLHEHILSLQVNETTLKKKMETVTSKCVRLESSLVKTEKSLHERSKQVFDVQLAARTKQRDFFVTIENQRKALAGSVNQLKFERAIHMLDKVQSQTKSYTENINKLNRECFDLNTKILEQSEKLDLQEDLLNTLKYNNSNFSEKIQQWHKDLSELRLKDIRLRRELEFIKTQIDSKDVSIHELSATVTELEDKYLELQMEFEQKQLSWERREFELENVVYQKIEQDTVKQESQSVLSRNNNERNMKLIQEKNKLIESQSFTIEKLERKVIELSDAMKGLQQKMLVKENEIADIQTQARESFAQQDVSVKTEKTKIRRLKKQLENESKALRVAQQTILVLQEQMDKKELTVQKYQDEVKQIMRDMQDRQRKADKEQIEKLLENNNQRIASLKSAAAYAGVASNVA